MTVVTRFAPSPTGFLHIGSARTAFFNWLFARHYGGSFLLRIEDTDRVRSTPEAVQAILDGMRWLQLDWDGETIFQFARAERHRQVAHELLASGKAYACYCSPEELQAMRDEAKAQGLPPRYSGVWRDRSPGEAPSGVSPVIRLKAPQDGETTLHDRVQGIITVHNKQMDDMVLLRADGTPTYMLSVVVDDHDMGVTHVIRGDDHLTNAFRQYHIYEACGWTPPSFGHIPLIHGSDGAKLSKRHGALGVEAYRDMGILPEALCNYLLRLGWSHGDEEIISREQAIAWFDGTSIGRGAARFDMAKLISVNTHYLQAWSNEALLQDIQPLVETQRGRPLSTQQKAWVLQGMDDLKKRAKTLVDLAHQVLFYTYEGAVPLTETGRTLLEEGGRVFLAHVYHALQDLNVWTHTTLSETLKNTAQTHNAKLAQLAQPLRVALTGHTVSPGVFEVMEILGRHETLRRIQCALKGSR